MTTDLVHLNGKQICMVAYSFYESDGRVMRYAEALHRAGATVDALSLRRKGQDQQVQADGVNVIYIQERERNEKHTVSYLFKIFLFMIRAFVVLTKRNHYKKYDLIHVHNVPDFLVFMALIPRIGGAKIILDIHDILPEFFCAKFETKYNSILMAVLKFVEKQSCNFSDHVIVANDIWRDRLINRSVSEERCSTILNYPDANVFSRHKSDLLSEEKADKFKIIYPGSLNWHQGLDIAIEAIGKITKEVPELEFHIYGEGPAKTELLKQILNLGLQDVVFIHPPRRIKDIPKIIALADLGIVPKRNDSFGGEAFSTKILEFMSMSIPIVVSKTTIDNFYFNEKLVRFFSPGDSDDLAKVLLEAYFDRDGNKALVKNADLYIKENCWEKKQRDYLFLVQSLINKDNEGL